MLSSLEWETGRRLMAATTTGGTSLQFTYDVDGLRLTKNVGSTAHKYIWQGDRLVSEAWGNEYMEFFYDESGTPSSFYYYNSSSTGNNGYYYYVTNLQGDIVGIRNSTGSSVATYEYDAWGKLITAEPTSGSVGNLNPLRYRGYYYDSETGLYYLQSRYYDPEVCRFINADDPDVIRLPLHHFGQYNLFAYCNNNPIIDRDDGGNLSRLAKIAIGVAAIAIGVGITAITGGAAIPALVAGVKAACIAGAIAAGTNAAKTAVTSAVAGDNLSTVVNKSATAAIDGFADGFMAGGIASGASQLLSGGFKIAAKLGAKTGRNAGIPIGKSKIMSPDAAWHKNNGGTLFKFGDEFRIDVSSKELLHMHLPNSTSHIQIGTIGAGIYGGLK